MTNATLRGKPDAGNPHVRFDEGEVAPGNPRRGSLLYKSVFVGAVALCLMAPAAVITNETLVVTEDTTWSGVTNLYSATDYAGSICANFTLQNKSYVRLIGHCWDSEINPHPQFFVATNANDVTMTISGGSAFYAGYRSHQDWGKTTGIDVPSPAWIAKHGSKGCWNDNETWPQIDMHVGNSNGVFGSTGAFKVKVSGASSFSGNAAAPFWVNYLYVEPSVKTNAPGFIDLIELGGTSSSEYYVDVNRLENHNAYPVRILFKSKGGTLRDNNANHFNNDRDMTLAPSTGHAIVLQGDDTYDVRFRKQFKYLKFTARLGGTVYFRGKNVQLFGANSTSNFMTWELDAKDNVVWEHTGTLKFNSCHFNTTSHDVLPHAATHGGLVLNGTKDDAQWHGATYLDLHGTTQHVNGVTCENYAKTESRFPVITNEVATVGTLVLGEHDFDSTLQARCAKNVRVAKIGTGTLTLLDATGEYLDVTAGKVTTSGSCDFGTVALAEGTQLTGTIVITNSLAVAGTGVIRYENTIVNLASGATISIGADTQLVVDQLTVNGAEIDAGQYAGTAWLPQGRVRVLETTTSAAADPTTITWTAGGGADTSVATAANWGLESKPDLNNLSLKTVFATAGSEAVFADTFNYLNAIVFDAPGDFTLKGPEGTDIRLRDGIETKPLKPGEKRTYTVEMQVSLIKDKDYAYTMPSNATVHLKGGLAGEGSLILKGDKIGSGTYAYSTNGTLILENATLRGRIEHKLGGGWLVLRGEVGTAGDTSLLDIYYGAPTDGSTIVKPEAPWIQTGCTRLENVNVHKPVILGGVGQISGSYGTDNFFVQAASTTNTFFESVAQGASVSLKLEKNSTARFNGGFTETKAGVGALTWFGTTTNGAASSTIEFGAPIDHREKRGWTCYSMILKLKCAGSRVSPLIVNNTRVELSEDEALLDTVFLFSNSGTFDLCGTRQSLRSIVNWTVPSPGDYSYSRRIISSEPAELVITEGAFDATQAGAGSSRTNLDSQIYGPVTVTMAGAGTLYVRPHTYTYATGGLKAEAGTLDLLEGNSWPNATALTVTGTGTFKTHSTNIFDSRKLSAYLGADADDWMIDLPEGTSLRVAWAFDADGNPLPSGVYGNSAVSGVTKTRYSSHFPSKGGVLIVSRQGTTLIFR